MDLAIINYTYPVNFTSFRMIWRKCQNLFEMLKCFLNIVLIVEAKATNIDSISTLAVLTQNVTARNQPNDMLTIR